MEIGILYSLLLFFFFFLLFLSLINPSSSFKKSNKTLPPGPWKLPFLGNLHQLAGSPPLHCLRDLANKFGPLMHLQLGQTCFIIVTSPEIAKQVLKTHDHIFANRPNLLAAQIIGYNNTDIAFAPYGHYWRQLRKICTLELLSVKRVQSFSSIREEEISELVKFMTEHEGSAINLREKSFALTNSIVARAAFGRSKNVEAVLSILQRTVGLASGFKIADLFPSLKILPVITGMKAKIEKLHRDCDRILQDVITDHEEKKNIIRNKNDDDDDPDVVNHQEEDLVDVLLKIQKDNDLEIQLSYDNIKAVILDMFSAGTRTSAQTIEWIMSELLKNPEIMKEAQGEVRRVYENKGYVDESELHKLKYIDAVIKETLRLHPPLPLLIPRESSKRCEINGYEIPQKTRVIINAWALGRDPKYWNEADKFQPQRFINNTSIEYSFRGTEFEYIPFGSGRRICPGISFGYAVIELVIAKLLYHFDWKLPNGMKPEEFDMDESVSADGARKNALCLVPMVNHP
ncbi:cytochrome P450 71D10-like [Prosopis cineraria]|uniref:cytochrome P450 71D10-like n=1 Tax=Prosopis cineraria TaxID=364024 RepID=UPI00240FC9CC|nr:cytochrome P450 71D10-like [Prosopis cineraria]